MNRPVKCFISIASVALFAACTSMSSPSSMSTTRTYDQGTLPDAVKVPAGHRVALETVGVGELTYECRAKAGAADAHEWVFAGPRADLNSRSGTKLGSYYGPPATWETSDGSKITGTQVAIAPAGAGNIPAQLVKANPATGSGAMTGIAYVQRVATRGGVAPATVCDKDSLGACRAFPPTPGRCWLGQLPQFKQGPDT